MNRRGFLLGLGVAPAIVRAGALMPVRSFLLGDWSPAPVGTIITQCQFNVLNDCWEVVASDGRWRSIAVVAEGYPLREATRLQFVRAEAQARAAVERARELTRAAPLR